MSTPIQSINLETIFATKTYTDLNTLSVVNQSLDVLLITDVITNNYVQLFQGQTLTLTANTGFVLPQLVLDSFLGGSITASIITS